ncbi:hypothetical protein TRVL_06668 [Trypanosoma vivax]|nr:hypothetical protein TRVL_06668 [Trypanosoma vivax]
MTRVLGVTILLGGVATHRQKGVCTGMSKSALSLAGAAAMCDASGAVKKMGKDMEEKARGLQEEPLGAPGTRGERTRQEEMEVLQEIAAALGTKLGAGKQWVTEGQRILMAVHAYEQQREGTIAFASAFVQLASQIAARMGEAVNVFAKTPASGTSHYLTTGIKPSNDFGSNTKAIIDAPGGKAALKWYKVNNDGATQGWPESNTVAATIGTLSSVVRHAKACRQTARHSF